MVDGTEDLPERQDAIDAAAASVGSLTRKIIDLGDDAGAADALYEAIVEWATETKNVELYDAQDEAVMETVTTPLSTISERPRGAPSRDFTLPQKYTS